eukprot:tig00020780_g13764.t1
MFVSVAPVVSRSTLVPSSASKLAAQPVAGKSARTAARQFFGETVSISLRPAATRVFTHSTVCAMRQVVQTDAAPSAVGPYSQAIKTKDTLYVSGCLGLVPATMDFESATDVEIQTEQALKNLKAIIEAGGSRLENVVKTTILLAKIDDFAKVNAIYAKYFPKDPPARSTFAVAALPKAALVEIEAIALLD